MEPPRSLSPIRWTTERLAQLEIRNLTSSGVYIVTPHTSITRYRPMHIKNRPSPIAIAIIFEVMDGSRQAFRIWIFGGTRYTHGRNCLATREEFVFRWIGEYVGVVLLSAQRSERKWGRGEAKSRHEAEAFRCEW